MKKFFLSQKPLNNEQGVALVVVLIVLVVVSILGLTITTLAANNMKMSMVERTNQSTYYIAESGITYQLNEIQKKISGTNPGKDMNKYFNDLEGILKLDQWVSIPNGTFESSFGQTPTAKIKISKASTYNSTSNSRSYLITSMGTIEKQTRTAEKTFTIIWNTGPSVKGMLNTAVFVNDKIDMSGKGGQTINGAVGTNASAANSIVLGGNANIIGNIFVGPNAKNDVVFNTTSNKLRTPIPVPETKFIMPEFPSTFPVGVNKGIINLSSGSSTINMDQDFKYSSITIDRTAVLNINIGNNNRSLIVDQLNVPNGYINIIGGGNLKIYVNNLFTMGSASIINSADKTNQLEIFYKGTSTLNFGGSTKVYGSLLVEQADLNITNGAGFQGHIVSLGKNLSFTGGTMVNIRMLYAPNANVTFANGAIFSGSVVSKSVQLSGNSTINYGMPNIDDLSFFETSGQNANVSIDRTMAVREK